MKWQKKIRKISRPSLKDKQFCSGQNFLSIVSYFAICSLLFLSFPHSIFVLVLFIWFYMSLFWFIYHFLHLYYFHYSFFYLLHLFFFLFSLFIILFENHPICLLLYLLFIYLLYITSGLWFSLLQNFLNCFSYCPFSTSFSFHLFLFSSKIACTNVFLMLLRSHQRLLPCSLSLSQSLPTSPLVVYLSCLLDYFEKQLASPEHHKLWERRRWNIERKRGKRESTNICSWILCQNRMY